MSMSGSSARMLRNRARIVTGQLVAASDAKAS